VTPIADRVLRAAREEIGRRAAAGGPPWPLDADRLAGLVEADPAARGILDAAVVEARFVHDAPDDTPGARRARRERHDRAREAVDELLLVGELAPDGPGRVVLPGFGPSTWGALATLRAGARGPEAAWAAALVHDPLADLGDAAPAALTGVPRDPRLAPLARDVHAHEAARQDARDALLRAEAAAGHAAARGLVASLATIRADMALLGAALDDADAAVADLRRRGLARAAG